MQTIINGNYGATIRERNDGDGFDVYFLYNMKTERHGDVHSRKTFKARKTADAKVAQYFSSMGVA